MLQRFVISCVLLGVLQSCSLALTKGLTAQPPSIVTLQNPYFADQTMDYVYKAQLQVYGNYFGGILVIKKIAPQQHRVVFTTEMGKSLFDFEFRQEEFKIHYIIEELDRKLLLNILENDFRMLTSERQRPDAVYQTPESNLYKVDVSKRWRFYEVDKSSAQLKRIVQTSSHKEKMAIEFSEISEDHAKKIKIAHFNLKLTIDLYAL